MEQPFGNDNGSSEPAALEFLLAETGIVWMYRDGEPFVLGPREAVCAEMCRFLESVDYAQCA